MKLCHYAKTEVPTTTTTTYSLHKPPLPWFLQIQMYFLHHMYILSWILKARQKVGKIRRQSFKTCVRPYNLSRVKIINLLKLLYLCCIVDQKFCESKNCEKKCFYFFLPWTKIFTKCKGPAFSVLKSHKMPVVKSIHKTVQYILRYCPHVQGVSFEILEFQKAVALKWCIFDPGLVKPKCVWEVEVYLKNSKQTTEKCNQIFENWKKNCQF